MWMRSVCRSASEVRTKTCCRRLNFGFFQTLRLTAAAWSATVALVMSCAQAQGPEASWPWHHWERTPANVTRWPQLDSVQFQAWRQVGIEGYRPQSGSVYLVPQAAGTDNAETLDRLEIPRLDNAVQRVWWWPISGEAMPQDHNKVELRGTEYVAPFIPPANHLLTLTQSPTVWTIELRNESREAFRQGEILIVIDLLGDPAQQIEAAIQRAGADGSIVLPAAKAKMIGTKLQFEPLPHKNTVGYWVDPRDRMWWRFAVAQPTTYRVEVLGGCGAGQGGSRIELNAAGQSLEMTVEETGHFQNFRWREIGEFGLPAASELRFDVRCVEKAKAAVMDIREIRLTPVDPQAPSWPRDIRNATPDVTLPPLTRESPAPGSRSLRQLNLVPGSAAYHVLTLPTDYRRDGKHPILVEWTGNGPYENELGDRSTGRVEDALLSHGLSGGDGWILLSLPFVNQAGTANVSQWWGDPPSYQPDSTLQYAEAAIAEACDQWGGDRTRVVLVGFSRGSIACSALGLSNDPVASWWCGLVSCSHFDGVRPWPPTATNPTTAIERLRRLGTKPQFVLAEANASVKPPVDELTVGLLAETRQYLEVSGFKGNFSFAETGFINHSDRWATCPCPARVEVRRWLEQFRGNPPKD